MKITNLTGIVTVVDSRGNEFPAKIIFHEVAVVKTSKSGIQLEAVKTGQFEGMWNLTVDDKGGDSVGPYMFK